MQMNTQTVERKTLIHNVVYNLFDGAFFGFALGFASFTTIIPLFVSNMTSSALLIGLIPAIHNVGWQFPQLLTAGRISRMERFKPYVMFMTTNERIPFVGLAIIAFLLPHMGVRIALPLTFVLLIWQGMGAGLTANAWQLLISKIFPSGMVATFLGSQSAASNLLASFGAVLAGIILKRGDSSNSSFAICFLIAAGLLSLSWVALNQTKESPRVISIDTQYSAPLFSNIKRILKSDSVFRNFLISRFLSQFGMMAFPFFTVFAVKQIGMDTLTVGIMTSVLLITQTIANPLLGWLADHWSRKWVLAIGNICAVVSALLAMFIKEPGWFAIPFILYGIANTSFWTIGMAFTLEFGTDIEKPVYVGMANTLISPATICAPLLGGLFADMLGYSFTFMFSSVFALLTTAILIFIVKDPQGRRKGIYEMH